MRFLDLDLDFFLNENAYCGGSDSRKLGTECKPWSVSKVRHFLEDRCGLSADAPVKGRTVESHDRVLNFWRMLIESGGLGVPFEVIHVDAHPDLWIGDGLYLSPKFLHVDLERALAILKEKQVHPGNYLTFAIVYGWIGSLVWVLMRKSLKDIPKWDGDAMSILAQLNSRKGESYPIRDLSIAEKERIVPFKILPLYNFRTRETFDYIALSRSPNFTPPESDELVTIVEGYMKQV